MVRPLIAQRALALLAAAFAIWRGTALGRRAALAIFALNLVVLAAVTVLHVSGAAVAATSLGAMSLRTGFWLALWLALSRLTHLGTGSATA